MSPVWPTIQDLLLTTIRWTIGLVGGTIAGLLLAVGENFAMRSLPKYQRFVRRVLAGPLDFLRALPIIALVPLIQMIAINEYWKIGLIGWAVMFPMWVAIRQALERELLDAELMFRASLMSAGDFFRHYRFPKALGGLLRGVEISIGVAWLSVVAGEWVGTFSAGFWGGGLGYRVLKAHDANSWGGMFACLALFGLCGSLSAWTWRRVFTDGGRAANGFSPMRGYID